MDAWFAPAIATRLTEASLSTLGALTAHINRHPHRWFGHVPRLGARGAARIVAWLGLHAATLDVLSPLAGIRRRALGPDHPALRRPSECGVVPLESLSLCRELGGAEGLNRAPLPAHQTQIDNDLAAVNAWLATRRESPHTARAYRREAERLLLWAVIEKHKPLSSLNTLDCADYIGSFLRDPQPAARWIGAGRVERFHRDWRPFTGGLSDRSRETARTILRAMCAWLVAQRYLASNPFSGLQGIRVPVPIDVQGRALSHAQWRFLLQSVTRIEYSAREARNRFGLLLAYATGLRRAELAAATLGDLSRTALDASLDDAWQLRVIGKGHRVRSVPLPRLLMDALRDTLESRGLPRDPGACASDTPLIGHARHGKALSADGLGRVFKQIFEQAACALDGHFDGAAADLRRGSTHWLRHTHSNHALDAGADLRDVQANLGHASLATTSLYVRSDDVRRYRAMDAFLKGAVVRSVADD